MKNIITLKSAVYGLVAVFAVATFTFAVVPNMPEVPSASDISAKVLSAFACCGDGPGGGNDASCFPAGTKITLADGTEKNIEDVTVGEKILSYDTETGTYVEAEVLELESPVREGYYSVNDDMLRVTNEHPIYTTKADGTVGWAAIDPELARDDTALRPIHQLEVGDTVFTKENGWVAVESLTYVEGEIQTYNLKSVSNAKTFFADGVLAHNKDDNDGSTTPTFESPTCSISRSDSEITLGESVTISWTTGHADQAELNDVLVALNGSKTFTPDTTGTKTFTLIASTDWGDQGIQTVTCENTVTVKAPPAPEPVCSLDVWPSSITLGDSVNLSWSTDFANSATLNGEHVSLDGSKSDTPGEAGAKTYTLTVLGEGGSVTCSDTVNVDVPDFGKSCPDFGFDFDVAKYDWNGSGYAETFEKPGFATDVSGNTSTANWSTNPAVAGVVAKAGTAFKVFSGGTSGSISKSAIGTGKHGISNVLLCGNDPASLPVCTTNIDPQVITLGDSASFSWMTENAKTVTLNGTHVAHNGAKTVTPSSHGTKTFTIKAVNADGKSVQCTEELTVKQPKQDPVCNAFTADPQSLPFGGGNVTLDWDTDFGETVTIDNGVGPVNAEGSTVVSVADDITYTLTVEHGSKSDQCNVSVDVGEKPKSPVCDAFTADPETLPSSGGTITLAWKTTNADSVTIDGISGTFDPDGSTEVSVSETITFVLTATGNDEDATCKRTVTVPEPEELVCTFNVSLDEINAGEFTTLSWTTENAESITIDQGIGTVTEQGSRNVEPATTTTYTLTATRGDETVQCGGTVTVKDPSPELVCELTASESRVNPGSTFRLEWNTSGASEVSIDQGIGSVDLDGSRQESIDEDTTFTLTATDGANEVQCRANVDIASGGGGGGGGSSRPRCDLDADKTEITAGEDVELSWDNDRTNDILLRDNRGNVLIDTEDGDDYDEDNDSIIVNPTRDTSYTLIAERGIQDDECTVDIDVESDVSVSSSRSQPPLVAGISLSQVPYTGFEAGPFLTTVFYILLTLWSLGVAYFLVIKREPVLGVSLSRAGSTDAPEPEHRTAEPEAESITEISDAEPTHVSASAPTNLPTGNFEPVMGYAAYAEKSAAETAPDAASADEPDEMTALENRAHTHRALLSSDALRFITDRTSEEGEQLTLLDALIAKAKASYPSEDGWIVLNRERIEALGGTVQQTDRPVTEAPEMTASTSTSAPAEPVGASSLAEAIVTKNAGAANRMLGSQPLFALTDATADLDNVYRARKGEHVVVSDMLKTAAKPLTDEQLENAITALTSAIDGTYRDETAAAKLAIMKAVKAVS